MVPCAALRRLVAAGFYAVAMVALIMSSRTRADAAGCPTNLRFTPEA